ncbi:hypothetical protein PHYBLDRAFT_64132 [Phycomyces blakesleeanus NRRL 1555(-)]|uniref:Uncharacterized protein n=1 Tax=Phycomyces blakesleeanus (strain ATCC 8743b / DSM 1359 / FGSC 10004 / NBRC 33097 / NRRL 1555) TaxID=763407 RepID=A0A167LNE3_PHYB8|nr:hypothetical protein PHYBLDRAFT_64132 [Phycomyces blakesleeanus NRRL 1555(-)]OAD70789.1 hypothetical protein PHYBLDRAFT_64132 [Phycomyces blakesleeanus NRRL 1555(-)]|eukprot:XP_018288829.1 hypothetical protein PHYBLDRAFT_64132 [Phycomyces blakesleeanus NRRL 1555(-)]
MPFSSFHFLIFPESDSTIWDQIESFDAGKKATICGPPGCTIAGQTIVETVLISGQENILTLTLPRIIPERLGLKVGNIEALCFPSRPCCIKERAQDFAKGQKLHVSHGHLTSNWLHTNLWFRTKNVIHSISLDQTSNSLAV